MTTEIIEEVVTKLVGRIRPIGETNTDDERFENLVIMCELVNRLVMGIDNVAYLNADSPQYSMKRAGTYAKDFISKTLGNYITD